MNEEIENIIDLIFGNQTPISTVLSGVNTKSKFFFC
jgi:hypothetical protein